MDVETIMIDGERWVTGESLQKACGRKGKFSDWFANNRGNLGVLRRGTDYLTEIGSTEGYLLSFELAARIYAAKAKPEAETRPQPRMIRGRPVDEFGLPILAPPKRREPLVNPYRL